MTYNPKMRSKGGNCGIDETFLRKAPEGMFRVIGVDTFDGGDWLEGDFETLTVAVEHADEKTKDEKMLKMHVYDDTGVHRYESGTV